MVAALIGQAWVQDLPVCLPGRVCVDQSPVAAPLIKATSALTPLSSIIAGLCFAVVGVALVLFALGVRRQWRGRRASGWLVLLAVALLLFGISAWWVVRGRLALVDAIYSDLYGQRAVPVPPSLIGSWPAVLSSSSAMEVLGGLALVVMLGTALLRRRRARRVVLASSPSLRRAGLRSRRVSRAFEDAAAGYRHEREVLGRAPS